MLSFESFRISDAYHPASNSLDEKANKKLLDIIWPLVNDLHDNLDDWLPQIAVSINSSVNDSTGKSSHYIIYGVEKRLPYDLLINIPQLVCNIEDYGQQQQIHVFSTIHIKEKLKATTAEMVAKQKNTKGKLWLIMQGDTLMIQQPDCTSKLAPEFVSPNRIVCYIHENKF